MDFFRDFYEIFSQKYKICQLWDKISYLILNLCLFCYSPQIRNCSDLLKTSNTFNNPKITTGLVAVQKSYIFTHLSHFLKIPVLRIAGKLIMSIGLIKVWDVWDYNKKKYMFNIRWKYFVPKLAYFSLLLKISQKNL